jgi:hypothetical protein
MNFVEYEEMQERYFEVEDCVTRIINDPLFEVYKKLSENPKQLLFKGKLLPFTSCDIILFELMKNHQDASTEFIVRLANDTLPISYNSRHELLNSSRGFLVDLCQ